MSKMLSKKCLLILFIILLSLQAFAYPKLANYVNDYADVLSGSEESQLSSLILEVKQNTSVEIALVTVPNTEGDDTSNYATLMAEQNGIGVKEKDNGILILWSVENQKGGFIAIGRGIEDILTDLEVSRIGRDARDRIDQGKYYDGLAYIITEIHKELVRSEVTNTTSSYHPGTSSIIIFAIIFFLFIFVVIMALKRNIKAVSSGTIVGRKKSNIWRSTSFIGLGLGSGGWSKGGLGGFGGFGGGSFGGGGARF